MVVVVVAHEVLHQIFRKEAFELAVELGCQGFVVAENERWSLGLRNDVGHGERLSGTGHPEQHLMLIPFVHAFHQLSNRLRLISSGLEWTVEFERAHDPKVGGRVGEKGALRHKVWASKKPRSKAGLAS